MGTEMSQYPDLNSGPSPAPTPEPDGTGPVATLTSVDEALEGLEWATRKGLSWVSSMVGGSGGTVPQEGREKSPEYEVVQCNWYDRQQRRQLRVTPTALLRVHPMTGEVRHEVPLIDVVLTRTKEGLMVTFRGDTVREV